mgnify:FL=1
MESLFKEMANEQESLDEQDLLPVQNLEKQADSYSNTLDKVKSDIDDFTEHGKIASESMYKDQAKSYEDLANVYDDIAKEYDKLAKSETDLEKKNGFEKQAQQARESALEYRNAIEDVNDVIAKNARMSTFEQLMAIDSDKGIKNVTQNFQSQMEDILEIQNKQLQGQSLDLSNLRVEYPDLADITDIGDSLTQGLGKMKTNALTDYLSDYLSVVSDYPDALEQAQSALVNTLSSMDLSGVNIEDAYDTIQ